MVLIIMKKVMNIRATKRKKNKIPFSVFNDNGNSEFTIIYQNRICLLTFQDCENVSATISETAGTVR